MTKAVKPSKRELTRAKVIDAAIDCIFTDGFHAAHTNRIAESAGVSWGVLQYHFGDKDGLLQAISDHIFEDFFATFAAALPEGNTLEQRVEQLIDVVWGLVSKKEYRVSVAILRNAGKDENSAIDGQKQLSRWQKKTTELWNRNFEGLINNEQQSDVARHLLFAALRGMVDEINPRSNLSKQSIDAEKKALCDAISFLLKR